MNNVKDLIFEYNGILGFVKECAKSGLEGFVELEERLSSFGENLNNFFISSLEEIDKLKKELNAQKLESEEIIAKLNEKLKSLSGAMTDADYKLCFLACKKEYDKYWDLLEEESQRFLVTSYFVLKKIKGTNADFSAVVLCLCKPYENELMRKIYEPFIIEQSKLPFLKNDTGKYFQAINHYINTNKVYMPIKLMFTSFEEPRFINGYWERLHNKLHNTNWNMKMLENQKFIDGSIDFMETYRNMAAHTNIIEEKCAVDCKKESRKYVSYFLSAYPKSK